VATAAQATPEVAGKPHDAMVRLVRDRAPVIAMMVGDRPATDGVFAQRLGVPFGLVRTGVTAGGREPRVVEADEEADDLVTMVDKILDR
jgi:ribonucleotide monophosphatase NagD (HAD superfamily)